LLPQNKLKKSSCSYYGFFLREKEVKKETKRNESTKRGKESEERSKEQMSEIEERKKERDLQYYLFYSKPMYEE